MEPVVKSPVPIPNGTHLIHVVRQPIFDRGGEVVAYELLFRGSADAVEAGRRDTYATSHVIVNAFTESGLPGTSGCSASRRT
jgi:c-di-GMP-related signal transduction protein